MISENLRPTTKEIIELMDKGVPIEKAYKLVKPDRELTPNVKYELTKKLEKYSLTNPKRAKKAALAVDKVLAGKTIGDAKQPNTSDILKAAEMILDRTDPKINVNHNINENISLSPVDLASYRTIDVTPGDNEGQ